MSVTKKWHTQPCLNTVLYGKCRYGKKCKFIHKIELFDGSVTSSDLIDKLSELLCPHSYTLKTTFTMEDVLFVSRLRRCFRTHCGCDMPHGFVGDCVKELPHFEGIPVTSPVLCNILKRLLDMNGNVWTLQDVDYVNSAHKLLDHEMTCEECAE